MKFDPVPKISLDYIPFRGGLDVVTPPLSIDPGAVRASQNFECDINNGRVRCTGYERFDGRPSPSAGLYSIIDITLTGAISVGDTITGVTSAATGVVLAVVAGYLVITKIVGVFVSGETLNVGGLPQATTTTIARANGASTALLHAQYKNLTADNYRADIQVVPGSGEVLGVKQLAGVKYAFRNNAGGTAALMYKATTSGWTLIAFGEEISFTNANTSVTDADTLTQGGVTATIARVVVETGTLLSGVNTGRLIITGRAGGNYGAGAATSTGGGALTLDAIQTAITLLPGGRFEFDNSNFGGAANTTKMYGCDGVNRGFEFDGTTFVPIDTGMTADTPSHVRAHKNQLFFSFVGSVQHSSPGAPYMWSVITGASEIAMGDTVTGFMPQPGSENNGALAIFARNKTAVLYGSGSLDWQMVTFDQESGAYPHSIQHIGQTIVMDDRGITSLQTTQAFGNFSGSALSKYVKTWLNDKRTKIIASCIARDKNQYRLFFTDDYAMYVTLDNNKVVGMMPQLFKHDVACVTSDETTDGTEEIFFGSDTGYVYQMERGTSFDGDAIEAYMFLPYNNSKSPRTNKRYRRAMFEVSGSGYSEFTFSYELGYNSTLIEQPDYQTVVTGFSITSWDSFVWDAFVWDGVTLIPSTAYMSGTAENVSLIIRTMSDYYVPMKFSGTILHYTPQRLIR